MHIAGILAATVSAVVLLQAQAPIPSSITEIARAGNVESFAGALVARGLRVGVIVLNEDIARQSAGNRTAAPVTPGELESAVAAFNEARPEYFAEITSDGTLAIAPRAPGGCKQALLTRRRSIETSGRAVDVLYRIYRTWTDATGPYVPPGIVGNANDSTAIARANLFESTVSVSVADSSLQDALNSIVRQIDGLGWSVIQRVNPDANDRSVACNVSLFDARGRLSTSWTITVSP